MFKNSFFIVLLTLLAGPLAAAEKPNILFIALDDMRPEVGIYGQSFGITNKAITPHLDQFATDSVRFDRAYVTYPLCLPSRASLLTGQRINFKGGGKRSFSDLINLGPTWPRVFRQQGYWTAVSGKLYHGKVPENDKAAWDIAGEYWHGNIKDWSPSLMKKVVQEGGHAGDLARFKKRGKGGGALIWQAIDGEDDVLCDGQTTDKVIDYIENKRDKTKPFLICAGYHRPHMPWLAPKKYFDLYQGVNVKLAAMPKDAVKELLPEDKGSGVSPDSHLWNEGVTDEQAKKLIIGYLATVSYVDAQIGRLMQSLKKSKLDSNTIVIIWGDHGYQLTDHGLWRKNTIYHISSRIPLLIKAPTLPSFKPGVVKSLVETVDLYPTLLSLAGLSASESLPGRNLSPLLADANHDWPYPAYISGGHYYGIVTSKYRYAHSAKANQPPKLFDLKNDPGEWRNLAANPEYAELVKKFKDKVERTWSKAK